MLQTARQHALQQALVATLTHASSQLETCYHQVVLLQVLSQMLEAEAESQQPASDLADSPVLVNSPLQSTPSPFASDGAQRGAVLSGSDDDECSSVSRADDNRWEPLGDCFPLSFGVIAHSVDTLSQHLLLSHLAGMWSSAAPPAWVAAGACSWTCSWQAAPRPQPA